MRFFESATDGTVFAGEAKLRNTPVDSQVELQFAKSIDLGVSLEGSSDEPEPRLISLLTRRVYLPIMLRIHDDKPAAVAVEIRQGPLFDFQDLRVKDASLKPSRKHGDYVWRFTVPANGERSLSYKVGGRLRDWED